MQYEVTLKYNAEDFHSFYERWIRKSKSESVKVQRTHLLIATIALAIAALILIPKDSADQLIFFGLYLLGVGIYYLFKLFTTTRQFNSSVKQLRNQVSEYLDRHHNTETMGLKITEEEIQYFENDLHISTHYWNELVSVDYRDDHFTLFVGKPPTTILIPKFIVSKEFYNGVLELTKTKSLK